MDEKNLNNKYIYPKTFHIIASIKGESVKKYEPFFDDVEVQKGSC